MKRIRYCYDCRYYNYIYGTDEGYCEKRPHELIMPFDIMNKDKESETYCFFKKSVILKKMNQTVMNNKNKIN